MSNIKVITNRDDIVAVANAVRSKIGETKNMTLGEMASNIQNISIGGGDGQDLSAEIAAQKELIEQLDSILDSKAYGGSDADLVEEINAQKELIAELSSILDSKAAGGSGIDGGYSVTFVDDEGTTAAVFSVVAGRAINAPVSGAPYWADETGVRVSFPYTPVADVVLSADSRTYADRLYAHFSVDPTEYPFVFGRIYGSGATYIMLHFANRITNGSLWDGFYTSSQVTTTIDRNSPEDFVSYYENSDITLGYATGLLMGSISDNGYSNVFVNFNMTEYASDYAGTVIDLNQ